MGLQKRDLAWWTGIVLYIGLIYATVPFISAWRKFLTEKFGYGVYDWILYLLSALGALLVVIILLRQRGWFLVRSLMVLLAMGIIQARLLAGLQYPIERIHFLQYGLLGAAVFAALRPKGGVVVSLCFSAFLSFWAGLGDEWIQFLHPQRVGEIRDVAINVIAGILGAFLVAGLSGAPGKSSLWTRPQGLRLLQGAGILTFALVMGFLWAVHGFGNRLEIPGRGTFYSSFTLAELQAGQTVRGAPLQSLPKYLNEGDRHLLQREYYCHNDFLGGDGTYYRKWDFCYWENEILENYYSHYMKAFGEGPVENRLKRVDRELTQRVAKNPLVWTKDFRAGMEWARPKNPMVSRVKSTLITAYSGKEIFGGVLALTLIFIGFLEACIKWKSGGARAGLTRS